MASEPTILEVRADEVQVDDEVASDSVSPRWDRVAFIEYPLAGRVAFRRADREHILVCQTMRGSQPRTVIVRRPIPASAVEQEGPR